MNRQAKELTKTMLSAVASLLLSVKNAAIDYQAKLFPFARAFLGLCLSGLLLVSCASGGSGPKRAGNIWWADYTQNSRENCTIDGQNMDKYWFNDTKAKHTVIKSLKESIMLESAPDGQMGLRILPNLPLM